MKPRTRVDMTSGEAAWTAALVLGMGILVGWLVFTPPSDQPPPAPQQYWNWGSVPDWFAAIASLAAAISTIAIAVIADRALRKREAHSERVSFSVIRTAIIADMEMAVRVSRRWEFKDPKLTTEFLCTLAFDLHSTEALKDPSTYAGLPPKVLDSVLRARGAISLLHRACRLAKKRGYPASRAEYIVYSFEVFAKRMRAAANAAHRSPSSAPWAGWKPMLDADKFRQRILDHHSERASEQQANPAEPSQ